MYASLQLSATKSSLHFMERVSWLSAFWCIPSSLQLIVVWAGKAFIFGSAICHRCVLWAGCAGGMPCPSSVPHLQTGPRLRRHFDASWVASRRCVWNSYGSGCLLLPSLITGSSNAPRVQRHFMLTERFSARNLRLNKLKSSPRRKQKMEGEALTLRCTACVLVYLGKHPGEVLLKPTPGQDVSLLGPDLCPLQYRGFEWVCAKDNNLLKTWTSPWTLLSTCPRVLGKIPRGLERTHRIYSFSPVFFYKRW